MPQRSGDVLEGRKRRGQFVRDREGALIFGEGDVPWEHKEPWPARNSLQLDGRQRNGAGIEGRSKAVSDVSGWLILPALEWVFLLVVVFEDETSEVTLGVTVNEHDSLAEFGELPTYIEGRRRLRDAALVIEESGTPPKTRALPGR